MIITIAVFLLAGAIVFGTARKFSTAAYCLSGFFLFCAIQTFLSFTS